MLGYDLKIVLNFMEIGSSLTDKSRKKHALQIYQNECGPGYNDLLKKIFCRLPSVSEDIQIRKENKIISDGTQRPIPVNMKR